MKKNTFSKILILSIFITSGVFLSASANTTTYQKTETNRILFYSSDDWNIKEYDNSVDSYKVYTGTPLLSATSPDWISPYPDEGAATVEVVIYKANKKSLKKWFNEYWSKSYNNPEIDYKRKKKKGKKIFTNKNMYVVNFQNKNPYEGNPSIERQYFIKQGKFIYKVRIMNVGMEKGENWNKSLDILRSMSIY